ncbi:unnamed protein product [Sphagnum troendelagicum]|uniref:Uncharacterized protein n=1 Tax=Sphagnum troendelagicum TaxID=128251 RepID=A0ABP0UGR8_9BRYO
MELFDSYFHRADLDKDGRISGAEAVAFFQGAGLPQVTLAKIWQSADQGRTGFLSRPEFYNALKLVTVAQAGRDITPEMVRAALTGPAAAQIPAPRINTPVPAAATGLGQPSPAPSPQPGFTGGQPTPPPSSQGGGGQVHQPPSSYGGFGGGQPVPPPGSAGAVGTQATGPSGSRGGFAGGQQTPSPSPQGVGGQTPQVPGSRSFGAPPARQLTSQNSLSRYPPSAGQLQVAPTGFSQTPGYGQPAPGGQQTRPSLGSLFTTNSSYLAPKTSTLAPARLWSSSPGVSSVPNSLPTSTAISTPSTGAATTMPKQPQTLPSTAFQGPGFQAGKDVSAGFNSNPSRAPWPKMTQNDIQRYTRVFSKEDTDKDGKITGEQARELFLSWKLPRGVLKQVWDLSDHDNDGMLSQWEFCTALYLMERHREGRPMPAVLPPGIPLDNWQAVGKSGSQISIGAQPPAPGVGAVLQSVPAPQMPLQSPPTVPEAVAPEATSPAPYKSRAPALEAHLLNQLGPDEQEMLKTKLKAAEEADKKVYELDLEILDYKEKTEMYRTKLQEVILFKSRCDNRLNEVIERAAADKREVDALATKYDRKFKTTGEVTSQFQAEESAFRDIQEKKMQIYHTIAKLDKGGDAKVLQTHIDSISQHLDDLRKLLNDRARRFGVRPKAPVPSDVPFGWQGSGQENAEDWDEDWDKFDDEGFSTVQGIMDETTGGSLPKGVLSAPWGDGESLFDDGFDFSSNPTLGDGLFKDEVEDTHAVPERSCSNSPSPDDSDGVESPEHHFSRSSSQPGGVSELTINTSKPSGRYVDIVDPQEFGHDVLNNSTSFSSPTGSVDQGRMSFNSADPFGDGGVSWAFHDDDKTVSPRASWGLQSSNLSTQTSLDIRSSQGLSRFGKEGSGLMGDSLDMGPRISSPRSEGYDGTDHIWGFERGGNVHEDDYSFSPSKELKESSFFGDNSAFNAAEGSLFSGGSPGLSKEDHYQGGSFLRFDSFDPHSPSAPPPRALDDEADLFASSGPFGSGDQTPKHADRWRTI